MYGFLQWHFVTVVHFIVMHFHCFTAAHFFSATFYSDIFTVAQYYSCALIQCHILQWCISAAVHYCNSALLQWLIVTVESFTVEHFDSGAVLN